MSAARPGRVVMALAVAGSVAACGRPHPPAQGARHGRRPAVEQERARPVEPGESGEAQTDERPAPPATPNLIEGLLEGDEVLAAVAAEAPRRRLQILLTPIAPGERTPVTHRYRVGVEYVFTASAIKTFASVLALRRLQALDGVDLDTPVGYCRHRPGRALDAECPDTPTLDDTHRTDGRASLGHELRKMHLVSNNRSFNHLYDFVGHERLHRDAWALGFESLRLRHRMGQDHTLGRDTPPMRFFPANEEPRTLSGQRSPLELAPTEAPGVEVGRAYIGRGKVRIDAPRDFSRKNHVSLEDLHRLTLSIARPELDGAVKLGLDPAHRRALLDAMTVDPLASDDPNFERARFSGKRYKLLWRGLERVVPRGTLRYVNKAGRAYGFHVESAYVEHTESGRAFVLTCAIYVDDDGVVGDDAYLYDEISRPFYLHLGEALGRALLKSDR